MSSNPRDSLHDQPFAAAYVTRILMNVADLVQGYSFWTCSDIFAENYFPSVPFHGGFGLLSLHGIPKPVYRAFELLHHLGTEKLSVQGSHETVDAWVVRNDRSATVLDRLQWETFEYFLKEVNPANGLIADKTRDEWPASIAATGLALAAYPIGVERGFMTRDAAVRIRSRRCGSSGTARRARRRRRPATKVSTITSST